MTNAYKDVKTIDGEVALMGDWKIARRVGKEKRFCNI